MYDIIGDIHGHADELIELLIKLDYEDTPSGFRHRSRQAIFAGDFIDRGPRILDTISIVRAMCHSGAAQAVMGNHELNALAYHSPHPTRAGEFLRAHTHKNKHQHQATLQQLNAQELTDALAWFRTLPPALDLGALRVVHACWDDECLRVLNNAAQDSGYMTDDFLRQATEVGNSIFVAIERMMKGPEMRLPDGYFMIDKEGTKRPVARIRWFESPDGHNCASYSIPVLRNPDLETQPVPTSVRPSLYDAKNPPVFVGHYWLPDKTPAPLASNIACVDYSVAKHGMLAAYRFGGEQELQSENFVTVPARS
jgi:hypothetical protein